MIVASDLKVGTTIKSHKSGDYYSIAINDNHKFVLDKCGCSDRIVFNYGDEMDSFYLMEVFGVDLD